MKVAGIIAEYNPFHNGHAYHIEEVRKQTGADYVIAIMSGNFVQRGAPAIVDKWTRTKMALLGGADLVIELPVVAATASAETFARCGVSILNAMGVVTHLGFGCETDDLDLLWKLADLFVEEPAEYQGLLADYLKKGMTYPAARAQAAMEYFPQLQSVLNAPNNILAIEYLKALKQSGSTMKLCAILRKGNDYHDEHLSGELSSATAIRNKIATMDRMETDHAVATLAYLESVIPQKGLAILQDALKVARPMHTEDFSNLLQYKLCLEANSKESFLNYADVKEELANRIQNLLEEYKSFDGFVELLKTKNMTFTSISRGLIHILLDVKKTDMNCLIGTNYAPYARVLGFRREAAALLHGLKESSIPVITQIAKEQDKLSDDALRLLQLDIASSHIYNFMKENKSGFVTGKNEYRTPLVYV